MYSSKAANIFESTFEMHKVCGKVIFRIHGTFKERPCD
jgi:hypothetical protein